MNRIKNTPKVLGLDISTKTIGWALFDMQSQQLLELTHISPRPKLNTEDKLHELLLKSEVFASKLETYKNLGIIALAIGYESSHVACHVKRMGGGFGGKESRS